MSEKIRKPRKPKPPANPVPPPTPEVPAPVPAPKVALPVGPIKTKNPQGGPFDVDWERITRWYTIARDAADEFGVEVARILAHVVIESQGDPDAVQRNEG